MNCHIIDLHKDWGTQPSLTDCYSLHWIDREKAKETKWETGSTSNHLRYQSGFDPESPSTTVTISSNCWSPYIMAQEWDILSCWVGRGGELWFWHVDSGEEEDSVSISWHTCNPNLSNNPWPHPHSRGDCLQYSWDQNSEMTVLVLWPGYLGSVPKLLLLGLSSPSHL